MKSVLILHAYSAENLGDGLLVAETLKAVRAAFDDEAIEAVVLASYPESFESIPGVRFVRSKPGRFGYPSEYLHALWSMDRFDAIVAVGGGYLRAKSMKEALKTALVHGPQLLAAAWRAPRRAVYLPQSIGPAHFGSRLILRGVLRRMQKVFLRDDRSIEEMGLPNALRAADLAAGRMSERGVSLAVADVPVLSVRHVNGRLPGGLLPLANSIGTYDSYIQSTVRSNDDRPATSELTYRRLIPRPEMMGSAAEPRVVVAVRLHAALMALAAGHYVVHLAYERKGFGAFGDLDIPEFVHNVNSFDQEKVLAQVHLLLGSQAARAEYNDRLRHSMIKLSGCRELLHSAIRDGSSNAA
ncbi:polysaccharide pyruvyl transferase CsaB [Stenotrophomonas maltophilia]|nr:polysaccharide pyruvyl transferase family protein [Stenotrophomonas geniculata]VTQ74518.1 polysaccharide pyruvyl transferase CsaB [Stenotrophomonas maltophilia]